jgi:S-adenosylmethionine-dependent methyltransferase
MNIFQQQIETSKEYIPAIEKALLATYFSNYDQTFLHTDEGKIDIENNVFRRYDHSLRHVLPWLCRQINLHGKKVLEIGCGTGSSTAALAHYVQRIEGYDIHALSVQGAQKRLEIMGLDNVKLHLIKADSLISRIANDATGKYDIILLFAVLEHQTVAERHETLKKCWELLAVGGIMAVIDTPNILHFFDIHTSKLPFLHMLPSRLYAKYAQNSPRSPFVKSFVDENQKSDSQLDLEIARWGRGASYHDFELTLGKDYNKFIVAEGFEPEILDWFVCTPEEEILRWYVQYKNFDIPLGYTRCVLNLIFRKFPQDEIPAQYTAGPFSPPSFKHFIPTLNEKNILLQNLEKDLRDRNSMIEQIYHSKTWRTGNMLAGAYRKMVKFIKG